MKIEPFLVASTVIGILAQRLVRGVCPDCKKAYTLTLDHIYYDIVRQNLPDTPPDKLVFYKGEGCRRCNGKGHAKRLAIHEVLLVNQDLRALISKNVPSGEIKELAVKNGMRTLFQDGLLKALDGKTSLEEIVRAAYVSE